MTIVVDASTVVAALVDDGPDGTWALELLDAHDLVAPELLLVEATNVLRRAALAGDVDGDVASTARDDLMDLSVTLVPFDAVADRVWELRSTITAYDASYVAAAEALGLSLATLDGRLARAPGARCRFLTPNPRPPRRSR